MALLTHDLMSCVVLDRECTFREIPTWLLAAPIIPKFQHGKRDTIK